MPPEIFLLPLLLLIGGLAGFLSGLLGVGGGTIVVPSLFYALGVAHLGGPHAMHLSVGTSLAVVVITVLTSARAHARKGAVERHILVSWGPWLAFGVLCGAALAGRVDGKILKEAFASVTLAVSIYMLAGKEPVPGTRLRFLTVGVQKLLSCFTGALAALTGMGGAVLTVPMMTATGVPIHHAIGTGAALGVIISAAGVLGYIATGWSHMAELPPLSLGYVSLPAVACIAPCAVFMVKYGVRLSSKVDKKLLRRIFAVVMALVSLRMFMSI